jgi:hypothetical protein
MIRRQTFTATGATDEVHRQRVPPWFLRAYFAAVRAGRVRPNPWTPSNALAALTGHIGPNWDLFDHWGEQDNRLVTEPYRDQSDPDLLEAIERFAKTFELAWQFEKSNWFPPFTCKIVFWPADPLLAAWRPFGRSR